MESVDQAFAELSRVNLDQALLTLEVLREKRRDEHYIKYHEPTPGQLAIYSSWTPEIKIMGVLGGNRSGKTEFGANVAVAWALGKDYFRDEPAWDYIKYLPIPDRPCNIWVVGLDFSTLRDVIWREKLRQGRNHPSFVPRAAGLVTKASDADFQIFFSNGSVITGKSADSGREKFQGASIDLVWIDEEPEADVFDECYQRTVDCGGKILITLTPLTDIASGVKTPWVFDLFQEAQSGKKDVKFCSLSVMDNPFVPEEEKVKLLEKWSGHFECDARLYGKFIQRSGLVYHLFDAKRHLIKPFRIPHDWKRIASIDPAATGITACVWGAVDKNNNVVLYREYYDRDKTVSDHARNMLVRNAGDIVDIWLIDPKWGSQRGAENHKTNAQLYKEAGIPVRLAEVGQDFGLNVSLEYMGATVTEASRHPKLYIFNDLHDLQNELKHYTWAFYGKGELRGKSKDKPVKRNDHLMNAMQYLLAQRPRSGYGRFMGGDESGKYNPAQSYT